MRNVDARRRRLSVRAYRWKTCLPTRRFGTRLSDLVYLTLCHSQIGTIDKGVLGLHGSKCSSRPGPGSGSDRTSTKIQSVKIAKANVNIVDLAHASVASLVITIESLLTSNSPMQSLTCDHSEDFSALHEKISSLEVFLKNFEKNNVSGQMTDLELQVKEVANIVEHTIHVRVTEVLEDDENQREKAQERLSDSMLLVAEDIDRIWKESTKIQNKGKHASKESTAQEFPRSSRNILNVENSMVGRDDQRKRLVQDLTRSYPGEPKVIPIVGMGGIGKTTLVNEVYNDACIRSHFDVCAWATVSQQHNVKEILLSLLRSTKGDTFDMNDEAELENMLQKSLKGKRYLIVLDDMWKSEAWDAVRLCFPSENKGSGILLTTRDTDVARDAGTKNLSLQMDLMGPDESWNLFKSVEEDVKSFVSNDPDE
ncbi:hypothetical protein T459_18699 [Capsicum annuum]|uniref:NB-ARC domain-containing protein n=1 Tax=Capsicum annuum TaxID=4072 RepID=A0A2G2YZH7_CAPAN|nr:hypothetical protein T459_18699 [Capsicum annuum]